MKVLELKGLPSYFALQTFHKLMLGLKMLPAYMGESYEDFYARIEVLSSEAQEKFIREAVLFVPLERDEIFSLLNFCTDANGVPYGIENSKSLKPDQLHEMMVGVCVEIAKIKVNFVSESEKKN